MGHTALENRLQEELEALVSKNSDVFNPVIGITNVKGDFYWTGAAGKAYADKTDAMKVDTPIFIASITKMFTGAATLILEEGAHLSLEDPLTKYLPDSLVAGLHQYKGRDYSDQLTIYHLISQTSGLPDYFMGKPKGGVSIFDRLIAEGDFAWNLEQVVDITKNSLSPKFPPEPKDQIKSGKKAFYSDTNYQLLGAILETVTNKQLYEIFSELIIEPLELPSTYLHGFEDTQAAARIPPATIYYKTIPFYLDRAMTSFGPDGGIVSTIEDGLRFLRSFMDGKLFESPATLERMKNWKKIFFPLQYGLGLMRIKMPKIFSPFTANPELIGHSGASSAFLFQSDLGGILIGGTLNQIDNQARPVRLMLKLVNLVNKALSSNAIQ
jgi:CubicO group peptidase (beta-lactamase class C family)